MEDGPDDAPIPGRARLVRSSTRDPVVARERRTRLLTRNSYSIDSLSCAHSDGVDRYINLSIYVAPGVREGERCLKGH
ncbi:hypothetical protein GCM10010211_58160 [Streptomyces albospinus]|uniref:Uncharacterized protein n=1 Tax=Streptomyces albospinus TaxID=285515 RepID=A0ABQ2VFL0_9ACTN|nr:hypothetical protein GCM10010211_58160 [Streptomyces albospinus]